MPSKATQGTRLRTPETWARYQNEPRRHNGKCFMCNPEGRVIVREFNSWLIIENNYPYDAVAKTHHLLVPKRHFPFIDNATGDEADELYQLKHDLDREGFYDCIVENFSVGKSQPQHLHYHLIEWHRT